MREYGPATFELKPATPIDTSAEKEQCHPGPVSEHG